MSSQRRRPRNQSATAQIVNFFLDQPLDVVSGALELAQTLVARRKANGDLDAMRGPRVPNRSYIPPEQQAAILAPYTQAAANYGFGGGGGGSVTGNDRIATGGPGIPPGHVLPVGATTPIRIEDAAPPAAPPRQMAYKSTEATRQRAKRSDAGQPRKRAAGAVASVPATATAAPRRRTRKPVDVPLPGTTANAPELPPQDIVDDDYIAEPLAE